MKTLLSAMSALGLACAAVAGSQPPVPPSDFESVRIIKVWEPSGQRLAPPIGTVVADFNRDAKPDVVSLTADESFIALGDGSGGFSSPIALLFSGNALAVADWNDDGNPDLAFTSPAGVHIAQGGGNAAFAPALLVHPAVNPTAIAVGDFNADTLADLTWRDDDAVHIALRTGLSTFSPPSLVTTAPGDIIVGPIDAVPGDDLAIGATLFLARASGSFEQGPTITADRIAAITDMDADTDADLICEFIAPAPDFTASLAIARQTAGEFILQPATPLNDPGPHHVAIADFDANGAPDVAAASSRSYLHNSSVTVGRRVLVALNDNAQLRVHIALMSGGAVASALLAADFDGDARPDIIVSNQGARFGYTATGEVYRYGRSVAALLNSPNAGFQAPQAMQLIGTPTQPPMTWDVDDDGTLDIVQTVMRGSERRVVIRRNLGQGRFTDLDVFVAGPTGEHVHPTSARIGDWNADGVNELLLSASSWLAVAHADASIVPPSGFDPDAALRVEFVQGSSWPSLGPRTKSVVVDLNDDHVEDVVQYASRHPGHPPGMLIAIARPGQQWETQTLFENQHVDAIIVGHFDRNPGIDIAVAVRGKWDSHARLGLNYRMHILSNDGLGMFAPIVDFPIGDDVSQIVMDDYWGYLYVTGTNFIRRVHWWSPSLSWRVEPLGVNFAPVGDAIAQVHRGARPGVLALRQQTFESPATLFAFVEVYATQSQAIDMVQLPWAGYQVARGNLNDDDSREEIILTDARFGDLWVLRSAQPIVPPPPKRCPGDTNFDNLVDSRDLGYVISSILFQTAISPGSDLNADTLIDGRDLSILLANFGRTCP